MRPLSVGESGLAYGSRIGFAGEVGGELVEGTILDDILLHSNADEEDLSMLRAVSMECFTCKRLL